MRVLRSAGILVITVITMSVILMSFPSVRQLGVSLLASAGLLALVVGMAARPALENLIAGLQIALTQPIKIDDVVVIEGEWGRIEEITATYVVVRIWDSRRLVVPLGYFISNPIENWTRRTADILGAVTLQVDYRVPVDEVRSELHSLLQATPLWDRRAWSLQVTNTSDTGVELRALMSARDSSEAWDLRCHIREELVRLVNERWPQSLPRLRAEMEFQDGGSRSYELRATGSESL
jgi:small-conductance mechanosensitive channel